MKEVEGRVEWMDSGGDDMESYLVFKTVGGSLVAQRFSTAFSLGCDPGDPGSSPMSVSLHGACFSSLCLCL